MAVPFDIVEHEYGARSGRERRYRPLKVDSRFGIFRKRDPGNIGSIRLCSGLFVAAIVCQHYPRSPPTVGSCLDEHFVHGDAVEPRGQLRIPTK